MILVVVEFELRPGSEKEFEAALAVMQKRIQRYDGFLGEEPCRSLDGPKYVTIFRFQDRESVRAWREDPEHVRIQKLGRDKLFSRYQICVCEVEREYGSEGPLGVCAADDRARARLRALGLGTSSRRK